MTLVSKAIWLVRYLGVIENYSLPKEEMLDQIKTCVSRFDLNGFLLQILRSSSLHRPHGSVNILPLLPSISKNNCNYFLTEKTKHKHLCVPSKNCALRMCLRRTYDVCELYFSEVTAHGCETTNDLREVTPSFPVEKSGRPVVISTTQSLFTKRMRCGSIKKFKAFDER